MTWVKNVTYRIVLNESPQPTDLVYVSVLKYVLSVLPSAPNQISPFFSLIHDSVSLLRAIKQFVPSTAFLIGGCELTPVCVLFCTLALKICTPYISG